LSIKSMTLPMYRAEIKPHTILGCENDA